MSANEKEEKVRLPLTVRKRADTAFRIWAIREDVSPGELLEKLVDRHCPEEILKTLVDN